MKLKLLAVLALVVAFAVPAHAQVFDPNLNIVFGAQYSFDAPVAPSTHRANFLFSANYPGPKIYTFGDPLNGGTPCYLPGPGFDLRTVDSALGQIRGFGLTVGVTCYPKGKQFPVQIGVTKDLTGVDKTTGMYFAVGISPWGPQQIAEKRAAKKAGKTWAQWKAERETVGPKK